MLLVRLLRQLQLYNMATVSYLPEKIALKDQCWPEGTKPLVTTRTMTYNHSAYIETCILGIINQKTDFPVQVLFHDDASTDGTAEVLLKYQNKYPRLIKVFIQDFNTYRHPEKRQLRKPFFDLISGKYIALCEGDDYWIDLNKIQKQYDGFRLNSNCHLIGSGCRIIYANGRQKNIQISSDTMVIGVDEYLLNEYFIATATIMMSYEVALCDLEDWMYKSFAADFLYRYMALKRGPIIILPDITAVYNKGVAGSWSSRKLTKLIIHKEYRDNLRALNYLNKHINIKVESIKYKKTKLRRSALLKTLLMTSKFLRFFLLFRFYKLLGNRNFLYGFRSILLNKNAE